VLLLDPNSPGRTQTSLSIVTLTIPLLVLMRHAPVIWTNPIRVIVTLFILTMGIFNYFTTVQEQQWHAYMKQALRT
jgi:NAD-dependent oxidoreductase involved in siderophore biosynthesis